MKIKNDNQRKEKKVSPWVSAVFISSILCTALLGLESVFELVTRCQGTPKKHEIASEYFSSSLTPWASIGGCGAGGSGGGGGGAKWIGKGVSGGLLDVQTLYGFTLGQNYVNNQLSTRLSGKPVWHTTLGLSIPIVSKFGEAQPLNFDEAKNFITGGLGDLSIDYARTLGAAGQWSLGLALSIPTGQYDIKRGKDGEKWLLPAGLQKGTGLWNASLSLGLTKDVEDGIWLFDISYSHPFAMRLFSGENEFIGEGEYYEDYADRKDNTRFYYRFKPYGENDLGDFTPPSINLSAYYGYRGIHGYTHSWGITFAAPFAVAWVHEEKVDTDPNPYNPRKDNDHQAWSATLNYGVETEHRKLPRFFAVSAPIHGKGYDPDDPDSYHGKWTGPDWSDFLQTFTFSLGVKATMF